MTRAPLLFLLRTGCTVIITSPTSVSSTVSPPSASRRRTTASKPGLWLNPECRWVDWNLAWSSHQIASNSSSLGTLRRR